MELIHPQLAPDCQPPRSAVHSTKVSSEQPDAIQEDPHFVHNPNHQHERKFPLTPSIAEFSTQTIIYLNLSNIIKILSLYQRSYDTAIKHPEAPAPHARLAVVGEWVDAVLDKYDDLSGDARAVVDMFVASWAPMAHLLGEGAVER